MKGRSVLKIFLYFLNVCAAAGLIAAYLTGYVTPEKYWLPAFFGLAYPVFLIINLLFVIFWLITWKRFIFVSLITILAGYGNLQAIYPVRITKTVQPAGEQISVLSFNIHSLYGTQQKEQRQQVKSRVIEFIASQNADIVCIQEFYALGDDFTQVLSNFSKTIGLDYYYFENYLSYSNKRKINAIAIFSRYPILHSGSFKQPGRRHYAVFSDMLIHGDTVRVYNLHLESIRFGYEDYSFYSDLTAPDQERSTPIREGSKRLFWKLRKAFVTRSAQVDILSAHLLKCPWPVILAGDFNDTPFSYTYHQFTGKLKDSFVESGKGLFQNTYAGKFPSFRIDYIMYSKEFSASAYQKFSSDLSDHFPITATLVKKQ
jgi:endonuclease/exonuclease/phosphatase family metal-dependent hydrolase